MMTRRQLVTSLLGLALPLALAGRPAPAQGVESSAEAVPTITAGVARANITPSVGFDNMGDYLRLKPAVGVGNELYVKAFVLCDGSRRVAIVTADVIAFPDKLANDIRRRIKQLTGIEGDCVLLSASHTHSSPAIGEKDHPAPEYLTELAKKIAGGVYMADRSRQPVLIGAGAGEAKVAINRWIKTPTGVRWGPNPDGPVDHSVGVLRIDRLDRTPQAVLVNYPSHPSILGSDNLLYSGDYTSYVQSHIEKAYTGRATALFTTGAGGDIKIAVLSEDGKRFLYTNLEDCRRYGTIIGAEAVRVAETIHTGPVRKLSVRTKRVELPLCKLPSLEEIQAELATINKQIAALEAKGKATAEKRLQLAWARATLTHLQNGTAPTSIAAEVQMIRLGNDIALFAVPGELFVEVGLKIKQAMRQLGVQHPFVVAYANGSVGYLPSKRAEQWGWCEHDDSYKLTMRPANFSGDIEEVLVKAARKLLATQ